MIVGYDPTRIATLAQLSRAALSRLAALQSADPAAADALWALRRLHRSIETGVLATADDIVRAAPLTREFTSRRPGSTRFRRSIGSRRPDRSASPTSGGTVADLAHDLAIERLSRELGLAQMTDAELFAFAGGPLIDSLTAYTFPDFDERRTRETNTAIAREFEHRAASNPSFVDGLISAAEQNPLVALAAAHGRWPVTTRLEVLHAALADEPVGAEFDFVRHHVVDRILPALSDDPQAAVRALSSAELMIGLIAGRDRIGIADEEIARLVDAAFSADSIHDLDVRGAEAAAMIRSLVELMNSAAGDQGLPDLISTSYTAGLVPILPHMIGGFDGREGFFLTRNDGIVVPTRLADTTGDVVDLLGGLCRSHESLRLLVASIPGLAAAAGTRHGQPPLYTAEELAGFVVTLGRASTNEQVEEQLSAERREDVWNRTITMLETVLVESGVLASGAARAAPAVFDATRWLVEALIGEDDLELSEFPTTIEMLLTFGIATQATAIRPTPAADEENDPMRGVRAALTETQAAMTRGATPEEIEAHLARVRNEMDDLVANGQHLTDAELDRLRSLWSALDHPGLGEAPFRSDGEADLAN